MELLITTGTIHELVGVYRKEQIACVTCLVVFTDVHSASLLALNFLVLADANRHMFKTHSNRRLPSTPSLHNFTIESNGFAKVFYSNTLICSMDSHSVTLFHTNGMKSIYLIDKASIVS